MLDLTPSQSRGHSDPLSGLLSQVSSGGDRLHMMLHAANEYADDANDVPLHANDDV